MNVPPLPFLPQAVVFDMDGLMLDSERAVLRCWQQAAAEAGLHLDDAVWLGMVGISAPACTQLLHPHMPPSQAQALFERTEVLYEARIAAGVPLHAGIVELLELLSRHGIARAVATSTRRPRALHKLQHAGLLRYFDVVATSSDVPRPKPAPDVYLLAARQLGVAPSECLVLEDSPAGVRAALAAGMLPIQVPDLVAPDAEVRALGHRIVGSLAEAQRLLEPWLPALPGQR
jgi:HAD superfamily hydrolase (TIGR01509 family)